jgi:hypothetical protein
MSIRLVPAGADVLVQILSPQTGGVLATSRISASSSGALGGQLLSAAHTPLQGSYEVEGAVMGSEDAQGASEGASEGATVLAAPMITPIDVAARTRPIPPVSEAPSTLVYDSSDPATADVWESVWELSHRAQEQMAELGISRDQVLAAAADPEYTTPPAYGNGTNHVRDGIRALVAADNPKVIIGISYDTDGPVPTTTGPVRRVSGGPGRRMPSRHAEMVELLEDHGFSLEHSGRGPHDKATHPEHPGVFLVIPRTPSDHRSYPNCIAEIRRKTGIDITQPVRVRR